MGLRWDFSRVYGFSPKEFSPRITAPQRRLEAPFSIADSSNEQAAPPDTATPLSTPRVGGNGFGGGRGRKATARRDPVGKGRGERQGRKRRLKGSTRKVNPGTYLARNLQSAGMVAAHGDDCSVRGAAGAAEDEAAGMAAGAASASFGY
ncbi:uncharacterized protein LOC121107648 isoform X2 [Gallus gallus]|uniref:uncharacterized protein LOC121107648 isoform X2 n=1 Tax=Gallus gallus TaxID=9031 RepID=UPI001F020166|nr:uncharacterized protein LOC121107648 isoform X2 [Gallus gallus]